METIQYNHYSVVQKRNYTHRMKDKNVTAILALLLGYFGVHRFYLGQIGLGLLYLLIPPLGVILAIIDFIVFLSMDQEVFDTKYNKQYVETTYRYQKRRDTDFQRKRRATPVGRPKRSDLRKERQEAVERQRRANQKRAIAKVNPFKKSGILKFKDYDFEEAIVDFNKALTINDKDPSIHFNLACAYSLTEKKEEALFHLDKAVEHGFKLYDKIKTHDALAYLRIQDEYEAFEKNNFRLETEEKEEATEGITDFSSDLLEQLKKLGELRDKGLLTEEEFTAQKRKILK